MNLAIKPPPFLGELDLRVNVLDRNREMDEVKVEVFETPERQRIASTLLDLLQPVNIVGDIG